MPGSHRTGDQAGHRAPAPGSPIDRLCVIVTVTCDEGHIIGQWIDTISEKYPFYCDACDADERQGEYPWSITTRIALRAAPYLIRQAHDQGLLWRPE
jgi:hypothetical protein